MYLCTYIYKILFVWQNCHHDLLLQHEIRVNWTLIIILTSSNHQKRSSKDSRDNASSLLGGFYKLRLQEEVGKESRNVQKALFVNHLSKNWTGFSAQQYCHEEFPFKFFAEMVKKRNFLNSTKGYHFNNLKKVWFACHFIAELEQIIYMAVLPCKISVQIIW
jgi:hypothetical protein